MILSSRLQSIADKIIKCKCAVDIGTDHAYIPIYLIQNNICGSVIATDINSGPIERAYNNIKNYGLEDRIELRQGEGLFPINPNEADCVIIAGMGGYLICDILEKYKKKAEAIKYFVIQPMQYPIVVRKYLHQNNYRILDEVLVKEKNKIYEVMLIDHGYDRISDDAYVEIGGMLIQNKDPLLSEYIWHKIMETNNIINRIGNVETSNAIVRLTECSAKLKNYKEVLKCL